MRFLIMNGPNLGNLGLRKPELYGTDGMDSLVPLVRELVRDSVELRYFQSNHEGVLIDRLEKAFFARREGRQVSEVIADKLLEDDPSLPIDGVILNAGAFTHTSLALGDCLEWVEIPYVEVHLTNTFGRSAKEGSIRDKSFIVGNSLGLISGFGMMSYALGVAALVRNHKNNK